MPGCILTTNIANASVIVCLSQRLSLRAAESNRCPCNRRTLGECYWFGVDRTRWARITHAAGLGREYTYPFAEVGKGTARSEICALCEAACPLFSFADHPSSSILGPTSPHDVSEIICLKQLALATVLHERWLAVWSYSTLNLTTSDRHLPKTHVSTSGLHLLFR